MERPLRPAGDDGVPQAGDAVPLGLHHGPGHLGAPLPAPARSQRHQDAGRGGHDHGALDVAPGARREHVPVHVHHRHRGPRAQEADAGLGVQGHRQQLVGGGTNGGGGHLAVLVLHVCWDWQNVARQFPQSTGGGEDGAHRRRRG